MRPTRRLVSGFALVAACALGAAHSAFLAGAAWACLAILLALTIMDLRLTAREPVVEVACELPARARLGEPFGVIYRIHNPTARALRVEILDERAPALGGDLSLTPLRLEPHGTSRVEQSFTPTTRGIHALGRVHGLSSSVLGLFQRRFAARADAQVVRVLPNAGAPSGALLGPDVDAGERPRRSRGEGMELDALRPYTEGDDPRHVDWRATARAQQIIVRTFREERNQSVVVAVDSGRMMATLVRGLCKLDHALNTTVALARAALLHGDRMGFAAFDADVQSWVPVNDSRRGMAQLLEATLPLTARPVESSFRVLTELLEKNHRKRSLIVILTDFVETADALELEGYLARLARRHVVLMVALRDPALSELDEPAPQLDEDGLYRRLVLQDLATERSLVLRRLTRLGVHTLDLRPEQSRGPVLARYLELRRAL